MKHLAVTLFLDNPSTQLLDVCPHPLQTSQFMILQTLWVEMGSLLTLLFSHTLLKSPLLCHSEGWFVPVPGSLPSQRRNCL